MMEEYLGILLELEPHSIRMSQPLLIQRIVKAIPGLATVHSDSYPALPSTILTKDRMGPERRDV